MNVLSLFDGMSCGQIALREIGIKVDRYYASETDRHAVMQTQLNFPDTIQLGNVRYVKAKENDSTSTTRALPCSLSLHAYSKNAGKSIRM